MGVAAYILQSKLFCDTCIRILVLSGVMAVHYGMPIAFNTVHILYVLGACNITDLP